MNVVAKWRAPAERSGGAFEFVSKDMETIIAHQLRMMWQLAMSRDDFGAPLWRLEYTTHLHCVTNIGPMNVYYVLIFSVSMHTESRRP